MKTNRECRSKANCLIDLLCMRKDDTQNPIWNPLLDVGHNLCARQEWGKAHQSFQQAIVVADEIVRTRDRHSNRIKASAITCIGALQYCRGMQSGDRDDISRGLHNFQRARYIFHSEKESYGEAIAFCALGQVAHLQNKWSEVFLYYESAQSALSRPEDEHEPNAVALRSEINRRSDEALKQWRRQSIGDDTYFEQDDSTKESNEDLGKQVRLLPIFNPISAGDPRTIGDYIIDYIEADRFKIKDNPYYVSKVHGSGIRLLSDRKVNYAAVPVEGDSMNQANIVEGDYVILRMSGTGGLPVDAQDSDIVGVQFPEDEHRTTLKRLVRREGKILFKPESTNPTHKTYEFDNRGNSAPPFRVVGILAAVLKPL